MASGRTALLCIFTWVAGLVALPVAAGLPSQQRRVASVAAGRVEISAAAASKRVSFAREQGLSLMQQRRSVDTLGSALKEEPPREQEAPHHSMEALQSQDGEKTVQHQKSEKGPKGASWFDAFAEGESTYNEDADGGAISGSQNPSAPYSAGWAPDVNNPYKKNAVDPEFFHESPGGTTAWQTHYPAATGGIASNKNIKPGNWIHNDGGGWSQEYKSNIDGGGGAGKLPAKWFDSSVNQYDGFGREKLPSQGTGKRLAGEGWQEQSVNTTLTCKEPGCVANATLQAFEWINDRAARCSLSVFVHPTDYDGDFGGANSEVVEWILVNGQQVSVNCKPGVSGCNASTGKALYPCVTEVSLADVMTATGTLNIAMKISQAVDECPYEGNMLSAVPIVSCMVQEKDPSPLYDGTKKNYPWADTPEDTSIVTVVGAQTAAADAAGDQPAGAAPPSLVPAEGGTGAAGADATGDAATVASGDSGGAAASTGTAEEATTPATGAEGGGSAAASDPAADGGQGQVTLINNTAMTLLARSPLKCAEPGCEATVAMSGFLMAGAVSSCKLTVKVNQTDYDGDHATEVIEYVNVSGKNIASNIAPGKNPCISAAQGKPLSAGDLEFTVVDGVDVTAEAQSGALVVAAKNSQMVDECASQGYLLDGTAEVECKLTGAAAT